MSLSSCCDTDAHIVACLNVSDIRALAKTCRYWQSYYNTEMKQWASCHQMKEEFLSHDRIHWYWSVDGRCVSDVVMNKYMTTPKSVLGTAIRCGYLELVRLHSYQEIISLVIHTWFAILFEEHVSLADWISKWYPKWLIHCGRKTYTILAANNKLQSLQWLRKTYGIHYYFKKHQWQRILDRSNTTTIIWIIDQSTVQELESADVCALACRYSRTDVIELCWMQFPTVNIVSCYEQAMVSNSIRSLEWLAKKYPLSPNDVKRLMFVEKSHVCFEWLMSYFYETFPRQADSITSQFFRQACGCDDVIIVQWIYGWWKTHNVPYLGFIESAYVAALSRGSFEVVQWLYKRYPQFCPPVDNYFVNVHTDSFNWEFNIEFF